MAPDYRDEDRPRDASTHQSRRHSRERHSRRSNFDDRRRKHRSDSIEERPSRRIDEASPRRRRRDSRSRSLSDDDSRRNEDRKRARSHKDEDKRVRSRSDDSRSPPRYRDRSRDRRRNHSPTYKSSRKRSPPPKRRRRSYSRSRSPQPDRSRAALPSQQDSFGQMNGDAPPIEKQKPNYSASGLLAKEANTVAGTKTVLKYHEPPEARKPPDDEQWRMFIFKDKDMLDTVHLYQRSCWLIGRDQAVADLFVEHPSISKQHAVIQFRYQSKRDEYGDKIDSVKLYLIDLESANATKLNGKKVEQSRFVELRDSDIVEFGDSTRQYVMMLPPK